VMSGKEKGGREVRSAPAEEDRIKFFGSQRMGGRSDSRSSCSAGKGKGGTEGRTLGYKRSRVAKHNCEKLEERTVGESIIGKLQRRGGRGILPINVAPRKGSVTILGKMDVTKSSLG